MIAVSCLLMSLYVSTVYGGFRIKESISFFQSHFYEGDPPPEADEQFYRLWDDRNLKYTYVSGDNQFVCSNFHSLLTQSPK